MHFTVGHATCTVVLVRIVRLYRYQYHSCTDFWLFIFDCLFLTVYFWLFIFDCFWLQQHTQMTVPLPKNLTGTSCFRVLASALQRYQASRAVHASARKYNQLFPCICTPSKPPCELYTILARYYESYYLGIYIVAIPLLEMSDPGPSFREKCLLASRLVFQATDQYSAAVVFACAQLMSLGDMCCKERLSRQPCMHDARSWTWQSFSVLQLFWTPDPSFCFDWISSVFTNPMENKYYCAQSFCFL